MFEIKDWKEEDCSLTFNNADFTDREPSSSEINRIQGEGGGLNASYTTAEAIGIVCTKMGNIGLKYDIHFRFKTKGLDTTSFDFCNKTFKEIAELHLAGKRVRVFTESEGGGALSSRIDVFFEEHGMTYRQSIKKDGSITTEDETYVAGCAIRFNRGLFVEEIIKLESVLSTEQED